MLRYFTKPKYLQLTGVLGVARVLGQINTSNVQFFVF